MFHINTQILQQLINSSFSSVFLSKHILLSTRYKPSFSLMKKGYFALTNTWCLKVLIMCTSKQIRYSHVPNRFFRVLQWRNLTKIFLLWSINCFKRFVEQTLRKAVLPPKALFVTNANTHKKVSFCFEGELYSWSNK